MSFCTFKRDSLGHVFSVREAVAVLSSVVGKGVDNAKMSREGGGRRGREERRNKMGNGSVSRAPSERIQTLVFDGVVYQQTPSGESGDSSARPIIPGTMSLGKLVRLLSVPSCFELFDD